MNKLSLKNHNYINTTFLESVSWDEKPSRFDLEDNCIYICRVNSSLHFHTIFKKHRNLLEKTELEKANRFFRYESLKRYLLGRMVLKVIIGDLLHLPPSNVRFSHHGMKPSLLNKNRPKFNVSYSNDEVLISLGADETGIDIEKVNPRFNFDSLIDPCFSKCEIDSITSDAKNCYYKFYTHWTRKEALLKYTGQGLIDHLNVVPSLDGIHDSFDSRVKISKNTNLSSFIIDSDCVASVAYPAEVSQIRFIEW